MLTLGSVFAGRFRVDREIAVGGMGVVYEVLDKNSERPRALKVLQAHLVSDAKKRQSFSQEALVGATLDSGHIVEVIDRGVDEATKLPWILMELLRGETLEQRVQREGALAPAEVARLFVHLGDALGAAHAKGVVHLDLKPANLFLEKTRAVGVETVLKVLDFGIARMIEQGRTAVELTSQAGTLAWMAPEQAESGEKGRPATDVWALGLIAFYLLTGREFWKAQNVPSTQYNARRLLTEVLTGERPPASQRARELGATVVLPEGFNAWFARCVADDVGERFHDAREAIPALLSLLPAAATVSVPPGASPVPPPPQYQATVVPGGAPLPPAGRTEAAGRGLTEVMDEAAAARVLGDRRGGGVPAPRKRTAEYAVAGVVLLAAAAAGVRVFGGRHEGRGETPAVPARDAAVAVVDAGPVPGTRAERVFRCPEGMLPIRGGEFTMGDGPAGQDDQRHRVRVSPYCLDAHEVTVAQFRTVWTAGLRAPTEGVRYPGGVVPWSGTVTEPTPRTQSRTEWTRWCTWSSAPGAYESHPINCIDWNTMQAYCVSRGARLPTEAEWEFAARGIELRTYAWGNEPPTGARMNACGQECVDAWSTRSDRWTPMPDFGRDPFAETAPVGSFPKTRPMGVFFDERPDDGLFDMTGNVWEWTADVRLAYPPESGSSVLPTDPVAASGETSRVCRGGGWRSSDPSSVRAGCRNANWYGDNNLGGRCARGPL